jgi:tetratricopeptide (TPR) repeat protein
MTKRRWLLVVLGGVLLLAAGASAALFLSHRRDVTTSSTAAYEAYRDAVANENRFYFKEARLSFARALELDPSFAMAMLGLARQSQDDDQRLALVKRAAREESRLTERERLHVEMALAYAEKRHDDAVKIAREIHMKYPTDTRSAQILAHEEQAKGNDDRAIRIFEELLSIDPNNAEAYNQIGYYYGYRGDYEKAMDKLKRYQFIAVDNANPFDSLGEVQAYTGHYNEAIENLNRALAIKPDFVESVAHLAVAYEGLGDYAKAIETYERAAKITDSEDMRLGYLMRGMRSAFYLESKTEILRLCGMVKALNPQNKWVKAEQSFAESVEALTEGRPAEALKLVKESQQQLEALLAVEKIPDGYRPHFAGINIVTALALEAQGKSDEALAYWKKNANPPRPFKNFEERRAIYEARAKVAVALARQGDLDGAEKLIAENRKWNPSWAPTREDETTVAELRREKVLAAAK